jgi:cob(I)alamin adenosyltransferase
MVEKERQGLIQIYTGEGKGKTTAALGLSLRAAGRGFKVCFIQFCKGQTSGEHLFVKKYPAFEIIVPGRSNTFTSPDAVLKEEARETFKIAQDKMTGGDYDLIVLDEFNIAVYRGFISVAEALALLDKKPARTELVLTGRYAHEELIKRADLVTEMKPIKHPYSQNIKARIGIEF